MLARASSSRAHEILGVERRATAAELRAAYLTRARETHPDANQGADGAKERFQQVQEAYDKLRKEEPEPDFEISELQWWKSELRAELKQIDAAADIKGLWARIRVDVEKKLVKPDAELLGLLIHLCTQAQNTHAGLWLLEDANSLRGLTPRVLLHGYNCLLEECETDSRADLAPAPTAGESVATPPASFTDVLESLERAGLTPDDHTNMVVTSWARLQ